MGDEDVKHVGPLFRQMGSMASGDLADELYAIAHNIEQALICAGAQPGKDYTHLDLIQLAQPFVLEMFGKDNRVSYTYPAEEVIHPT